MQRFTRAPTPQRPLVAPLREACELQHLRFEATKAARRALFATAAVQTESPATNRGRPSSGTPDASALPPPPPEGDRQDAAGHPAAPEAPPSRDASYDRLQKLAMECGEPAAETIAPPPHGETPLAEPQRDIPPPTFIYLSGQRARSRSRGRGGRLCSHGLSFGWRRFPGCGCS